jgi:hypothetical protein
MRSPALTPRHHRTRSPLKSVCWFSESGFVMARRAIPKSECRLLSRVDARRYCGGLGNERFDREVGPHCVPRLIGSERFYDRLELDAWIDGLGGVVPLSKTDWLAKIDHDLDSHPRHQSRHG